MNAVRKNKLLLVFTVMLLIDYYADASWSFSQPLKSGKDTSMAGNWKVYEGNWKIKNGNYVLGHGSGYVLSPECSYSEFSYEADVTVGKQGNAGLLFNACSRKGGTGLNAYYAALDAANDSVYLYKVRLGEEKDVRRKERISVISVAYPLEPETSYHLKILKKGAFIEFFLNEEQLVSIREKSLTTGTPGFMAESASASFSNIAIHPLRSMAFNWSWVKGVIYVPTNCVNQIQQWEEFDPVITDRELRYASVYGFNTVRVYLHYLVWEKDREKFLSDVETFLKIADKHHLRTVISFFDDVWDGNPHLGPQLPPVPGQHNQRWAQCPGNRIKENYTTYRSKLKAYVQDVVKEHLNDHRVLFWENYNEPGFLMKGKYLQATKILLNDSRIWIKETGTDIPVTSTADPDFIGKDFSDFYSWHSYTRNYEGPEDPGAINTECLNRIDQTLAGIVDNYGKKETGFIIWELGIGKTNSRFCWISPKNSPEPSMPFQGMVYPDGHPWDTNEVALLRGHLSGLPVFNVIYYNGSFAQEKKWSFTPSIDFDLGDAPGTGSPDASTGIDKDHFSMRWTGQVVTGRQGDYTFYTDCDNIARVWLGESLIIDKTDHRRREVTATLPLRENHSYDLKIEYIHDTGEASMHVYWSGPGIKKEVLPGRRQEPDTKPITKESMFSVK